VVLLGPSLILARTPPSLDRYDLELILKEQLRQTGF
jgi:hypothetical protein